MQAYKITLENNTSYVTSFNGNLDVATAYFLNKRFNYGIEGDLMLKVINIKAV